MGAGRRVRIRRKLRPQKRKYLKRHARTHHQRCLKARPARPQRCRWWRRPVPPGLAAPCSRRLRGGRAGRGPVGRAPGLRTRAARRSQRCGMLGNPARTHGSHRRSLGPSPAVEASGRAARRRIGREAVATVAGAATCGAQSPLALQAARQRSSAPPPGAGQASGTHAWRRTHSGASPQCSCTIFARCLSASGAWEQEERGVGGR